MQRLKASLEALDEAISSLEDRVARRAQNRSIETQKNTEILKSSRNHEAQLLAMSQKIAARLDGTIRHVEDILRD